MGTKAELIAELAALRQRVEELEKSNRVYEWIEEELAKAQNYDVPGPATARHASP